MRWVSVVVLLAALLCAAPSGAAQTNGDLSSTAGAVSLDVSTSGSVSVQVSGTWVGTIVFEVSSGGPYTSLAMTPSGGGTAVMAFLFCAAAET